MGKLAASILLGIVKCIPTAFEANGSVEHLNYYATQMVFNGLSNLTIWFPRAAGEVQHTAGSPLGSVIVEVLDS